MRNTIPLYKRFGAVFLCLALLCGVIMSTMVFPTAAEPTGVKAFRADFAELKGLVDSTKFDSKGYYAAGESDTAITQWVNNRFRLTYHREGSVKSRTYLGTSSVSYAADSWGGDTWWSIGNDGYLHYDAYLGNGTFTNGGEMLRKSELLTLKKEDGKLARFENFEASLVFNKNGANRLGAVYFSFHEQSPAKISTNNAHGILVANNDMVILGNALTYSYAAATNEGISYKPYGKSGSAYPCTKVSEALNVDKLDNSANYVLYVKCVGANLTIKVTSEDGATTYYNETKTITAGHEGYFSVGAANGSRALKSLTVTELDKNGNPVDFGTASYEPLNFTVKDVIPFVNGKYTAGGNPWYVFSGGSSNEAHTVFSHITNSFHIYYNNEGKYAQVTQNSTDAYDGQTANKGYFKTLYLNRWLERDIAGINGNEMFRLVSSLVPKNAADKDYVFKNFETTFAVRFGDNASTPTDGGVLLGFRQQTPGKFVNGYKNINKEQGVVAISKSGITIAAGTDISNNAYNKNLTATFNSALPQIVKVTVRVVNDTVTVTITNDSGAVLWTNASAPATIGYLQPGAVAYGISSKKHAFGEISLVHLDADGNKISNDFATDEEKLAGIETFKLSFDEQDMNKVAAKVDFYFNHEGAYRAVQPTGNAGGGSGSGNWVFTDNTWLKRTNVLGSGERVRQINALVPKDTNGYKVLTKNFSGSFDYRFQSSDGALVFGFRQKAAGRFVNGYNAMNTEQALVAITKNSIEVAGGTAITKEKFYTYGEFATRFDAPLPQDIHVELQAVGTDCKVEIYNLDKTQKLYSNTFTVNYEAVGYLALGVAAVDGCYSNINMVRLDDAGQPVDWTTSAFQDDLPSDGIVRFNADFSKLAELVTAFGADGYYTSTQSDTAVNTYIYNKFLLRYNNEGIRAERAYLGQSSAAYQTDNYGGISYWRIGSGGTLLRHTTAVGGEMMRKNDALYLKTADGYPATLKNFEATYIVEDAAQKRGAVTLSFRNAKTDRVVSGYNQVYPDQEVVIIGIDKENKFGITMGSGDDHVHGANGTYQKLQTEIGALKGVAEYRVKVRAVGDQLTVKITSEDGSIVYFDNTATPATLKRTEAGYMALAVSNSTKALQKIVVTELDDEGNPINFGTNTKKPYNSFSFSVTNAIPYSGGKYVIGGVPQNPWYDFAGAYGEKATAESSKLITMLDNAFASYYNHEAAYGQIAIGTTKHASSATNLHFINGVFQNRWLATGTSGATGMQTMRLITSLVPRNSETGEELQMKNFETTFQFRFEGSTTALLGFRQALPGKFVNGYWSLNKEQAFIAITKTGITIAGGKGIVSNMKRDENGAPLHKPDEGDMYGQVITPFEDSEGNAITLPPNIIIKARVVNETVTVTILNENSSVLWTNESAPAIIDYDQSGYIAYGAASVRGNFANFQLTRLDDNGDPIDINGGNGLVGFDGWDTSTTRYSQVMSSVTENISEAYDYYYSAMVSETPTTVKETMADHWKIENGYLTRQNDMNGGETDTVAMANWKSDGTATKLKDFDAIFKIKLDASKPGTFWVTARQPDAAKIGKLVSTPGEQDFLAGQVAVGLRVGGELVIATGNGSAVTIPGTAVGTPSGTYNLRVKVFGGKVQVYLNGSLRATRNLDPSASEAGYLCFGASGSPFGISEVIVNRLNEYGVPVDLTTTYSNVQTLEPIVAECNADPATFNLPTTLTVMNGGSSENSEVHWDMNTVNLAVEGDYTLIGYLKNTNGVRAAVQVLVGAYDREISVNYDFSDSVDMDSFDTWFLPEQIHPGKDLIHVKGTSNDSWHIQNGMLRYKTSSLNSTAQQLKDGIEIDGRFWQDTTSYSGYSSNMGLAVLKDRTYENFILDVDFKATYRWVGLGFGAANTPDGVYWTTPKGGYTFYIESESGAGTLAYRYTDAEGKTKGSRNGAFFSPYNASGTHHLRLIVSDGVAYFSLDGLGAYKATLPAYDGGYIYFALNDPNGGFDNLRITDLDQKPIELIGIKTALNTVNIDRSAGENIRFENAVVGVTAKGYEYPVFMEWSNPDYRSYKDGQFTFIGTGTTLHNISLSQAFNEQAKLTVFNHINGDFDSSISRKYYFDHENDLLDFTAYYAKREDKANYWGYGQNEYWTSFDGNLVKADAATDRWKINNGNVLTSYSGTGGGYNAVNRLHYLSTLILNDLNLMNFRLEVDLKQGGNFWYNYVIFGVQDPTKMFGTLKKGSQATPSGTDTSLVYTPEAGAGIWTHLEQEGYFNLQGSIVTPSNALRYTTDMEGNFIKTYNKAVSHHLVITVVDSFGSMQVKDADNSSTAYYFDVDDNAIGGYIGLGNYGNGGTFSSLKITALNSEGTEVPMSQAEKGMAPPIVPDNYVGWVPQSSDWKFDWSGFED